METEDFFGAGGLLAEELPGFQARSGQHDLAEAVKNAVEGKRHLIAEAPTGTGKSQGYGLPAAVYAIEHGSTVVIATANITLQEQLINKDLPVIKKIIDRCLPPESEEGLTYALVKGMSNYLCLLGLEEAEDAHGEDDWFQEISRWSKTTETGDKSELKAEYAPQIWGKVSSNSDDCLRKNCAHYDECFIFKMRRSLEHANIVVTNYHMLFTDVMVRGMTNGMAALLPNYDLVIWDEAHDAPDIAMDFQGFQLTPGKLKWPLAVLGKIPNEDAAARMQKHVSAAVDNFFAVLRRSTAEGRIIEKPIGDDGGLCSALRAAADFMQKFAKDNVDATVSDKAQALKGRLVSCANLCRRRAKEVWEFCFGAEKDEEVVVTETPSDEKQLPLFEKEAPAEPRFPPGYVYYLEENGKQTALCAKVVTPQAFLREHFFNKKTVIMTSATLSTGGDFDFIAKEMGLEAEEYDSLIVPSPFDPDRFLSVVPPETFPTPDSKDFLKEVTRVVATVRNDVCDGGVMALFTSHRNMEAVADNVRKQLNGDVSIYVQGKLPKSRIIESFKEDYEKKRSALILATSSFWQGVDIAGQALSVVIIDKIPFARPDDPVMHYLERIGENAFFDYSVPKAVIALKQGVGRLIRRETDFGCVVVLDTRLRTKNYRRTLLAALPEGRMETDDFANVALFLLDHAEEDRNGAL